MTTTHINDADMNRLFEAATDVPLELPACAQHSLYFLRGSKEGQRISLPDCGTIRLGRAPSCNISFPSDKDPTVSGIHAELRIEGGRVVLTDLDSTNGTYVNDRRIDDPYELKDRDQVELGHPGVRALFLAGNSLHIEGGARPACKP
jgi:pSer/pThr/pTyr-binding forkhead associated (FHA) protein